MKNKTLIWSVLGLLIIILIGVMIFRPGNREAENQTAAADNTPAAQPVPAADGSGISVQGSDVQNLVIKPVITRTDSGFQPTVTTIKKGATVIFRNDSSENMWPASAVHPTHTAYNGTSLSEHCPDTTGATFDACQGYAPGTSWEFTFDKVGTWGFHDHLHSQFTGKIIVTE